MWLNDLGKFNISFAEGFSTTQWKNFSRSFFSSEKTSQGVRGRAPYISLQKRARETSRGYRTKSYKKITEDFLGYFYVSDVSLNTSEDLPITIIWSFSLNT